MTPELVNRVRRLLPAALLLHLLVAGCVSTRTAIPMATRADPLPGGGARCLVVFLPGMGDRADTFFDERFVELVRQRGLSVDVVAADATFGYYAKGIVVDRLEADVLAPARARGYQRTWLVGASMGGFGSLFFAAQRPAEVSGVLALAPFLGKDSVLKEIRAAGGLARWTPPAAAPFDEHNYSPQLWRWLRERTVEGKPGPELWLGWGTDDHRLRDADALLGAALPPEHVLNAPGGHDWGPWRALLGEFLDEGPLGRECKP